MPGLHSESIHMPGRAQLPALHCISSVAFVHLDNEVVVELADDGEGFVDMPVMEGLIEVTVAVLEPSNYGNCETNWSEDES